MRTPERPLPRAALLAALTLACVCARGEQNPWYIGLSASYGHESNLLRLYDGQAAPDGYTRGDTTSSTALIGGFDQPFGRQHAYANAVVRDTRYSANTIYNSVGYTANAGLDWSTIERVSGSLTASANRGLYSFNTGAGLLAQRNLQDTTALNASVNVGLVTQYSLFVNAGHRAVRNSLDQTSVQALNFDQDNASIGIRWRPSSATTLGLSIGESLGRYPKYSQQLDSQNNAIPGAFIADRFKQPSLDLTATLQPTGGSNLDLRLSQSRTHYDLNTQRDFSGLTGSLGWNWQTTGKLGLSARLSRDTGQNSYAIAALIVPGFSIPGTSEYSQIYNVLRLQADWAVTGKVSITTALQGVDRTVVSTTTFDGVAPQNQQGKDFSKVLSVGARWAPLRSVSVGCDFSAEQRTASGSAGLTAPLHDNTFSCFGQFQLQQ